ncbi:MAG TPA: TIGR03118 family protein [Gemmataceae bacterium]|nr:TIGR03118 family protein [Gemmataceae bacterium]
MTRTYGVSTIALFGFFASVTAPPLASATTIDHYVQSDLVSDVPGLADVTDANLKNPWGISFGATGPFWVSDQNTGVATLYSVTGASVAKLGLTVGIPKTASGPQGPTGQVFNGTSSFVVGSAPAFFIFANLNGTISAWAGGAAATIEATTPGATYTGLAIDKSNPAAPRLYAANDAAGRIDVFDGSFAPVTLPAGAFTDPSLPAGLVPFNVQNIGGKIYVTYALPGRTAQVAATEGEGAVAIYDTNGVLLQTLISGSKVASPWGLALAPANFGEFSDDLLVGNFSYAAGEINAFDPTTGAFLGTLDSDPAFQGLWALTFGNGGMGGNPDTLYFSTGLDAEADGLFAALFVPEPGSLGLLGFGLMGLAASRRKR